MSKSVLISVKPEWCGKIASGRKTIELRKSKPSLKPPFKCYIYCTKDNIDLAPSKIWWKADKTGFQHIMNGKVIGEFVCDGFLSHCEMANADIAEAQSLVRREKILEYAAGKEVFGWHISELRMYEKPLELCEFFKPCIKEAYPWCLDCERGITAEERPMYIHQRYVDVPCGGWLKRPPQSWCYVEKRGDGNGI